MEFIAIIVITFISGVIGTGLGGLVGIILNKESNKAVSLLLSFAAGVMLGVVCFDLISSSFSELESFENISLVNRVLVVSLSVMVGYFVIWGLNVLIDKKTNNQVNHIDDSHPKTADDLDELIHSNHYDHHKKSNSSLFVAGLVMMFAIALHNFPEGMVIGASYAKYDNIISNLFSGSGFVMALIIGLHNIPEGMSVAVPLIAGGTKKSKALLLTALSGFPIVIGSLIGYAIGGLGVVPLVLSLGFASGAMLYVVFGELLPESILMWKSKLPALTTFIGLIVGFILVCI